jgi:ribosomal protein L11 methyltransferase
MCDYISGKDNYLLDYGCGTSILAIAGVKLGIDKAVAIDIDSDSIRDAKEYLKNNTVSQKIKLYKSDIKNLKEKAFDVIVCNIDRTIITKNIKHIYSKLKKDGKFFITGILIEELNYIFQLLKLNKFKLIESRSSSEWLSFYAIKL